MNRRALYCFAVASGIALALIIYLCQHGTAVL